MKSGHPHFMLGVDLLTARKSLEEAYKVLEENVLSPMSAAHHIRVVQKLLSDVAYKLTEALSHKMAWEHNLFCMAEAAKKRAPSHTPYECPTNGYSADGLGACPNCRELTGNSY